MKLEIIRIDKQGTTWQNMFVCQLIDFNKMICEIYLNVIEVWKIWKINKFREEVSQVIVTP